MSCYVSTDLQRDNFSHIAPPLRLHFGDESLEALAAELRRVGSRRPFVVAARSLGRSPGSDGTTMALVNAALDGFQITHWPEVEAHSPLRSVQRAAQAMDLAGADAIIAVGGGSAIVTARAANVLLCEGGDPLSLCTRMINGRHVSPKLMQPKLPQFVIPSTPTTAMAKAGSAMLNEANHCRAVLFDPKTRALAIFIHPRITATAPQPLIVGAALNTLSMSVEGLESQIGNPLSDVQLMHSLALLAQALPAFSHRPDDANLRARLMLSAVLCAQGTDQAGSGLSSVLAHALGVRYGLANGLINAVMLPHTMRFNAAGPRARRLPVSRLFGVTDARDAADTMQAFLRQLGVPARLRDLGVLRGDLPALAESAGNDWFLGQAPRSASGGDLLALLETAW